MDLDQADKGTWLASGAEDRIVVRATIHAFDLSVRGAYFDRERAFFNGTSLFLIPVGREEEPVTLTVNRPEHHSGWRVATAMQADQVDDDGFGRYSAADYDELIDHPFEISDHELVEFVAGDVVHRFALTGPTSTDTDRLATDLTQLCTTQIDFFGRPAPFESYTFLGLATGDGYGGLEHRASSSLVFRRNDLPKPGVTGIPRNYQRFLGLASHEYFHSWHVKRTMPEAFMPYRLDRRNQTRLLWVFEGITTYYQERFLLLSGLLGADAFLRRIAEILTRVYRVPGRRHQSLEQSSFNAWDRLYKPHPNSVNQDVSYYSKGAFVALALDLELRRQDPQRATLDDIVRALWQRFGSQGIGVPEAGFEDLAAELAGEPIRQFLADAVRGTRDPDLVELFAACGLQLRFRQAEGPRDAGGTPAGLESTRYSLGAGFEPRESGLQLTVVYDGQPAERAGLAPGDIIVALDQIRATGESIGELLARYDEDAEIDISYFRGDVLGQTKLRVQPAPADTCYIEYDRGAGAAAISRRTAWLGDAQAGQMNS